MSRTERKGILASCLGELLWYLAGSNDVEFIAHYLKEYRDESEDGATIYGAYGPRLFAMRGHNQIQNIINLLRVRSGTRRAVIQLFDAEDLTTKRKEIPCTCSFQFLVRGKRLDMVTYMRSNDAFIGLPHDVFAFTMLQEIIARSVDVDVGIYNHFVGSLHLYDDHEKKAQQYVDEGWQPTRHVAMPPMPLGDPWTAIAALLETERAIRRGEPVSQGSLSDYWMDLAQILWIHRYAMDQKYTKISALRKRMSCATYDAYIARRQAGAKRVQPKRGLR